MACMPCTLQRALINGQMLCSVLVQSKHTHALELYFVEGMVGNLSVVKEEGMGLDWLGD